MKDFEVIVSGGGLVGLTAALHLSSLGRRVMLVEDRRPKNSKSTLGFDMRTVLLSPRSIDFINKALPIDAIRRQIVTEMKVWEMEGTGSINFRASELGETTLGSVFEMFTLVDFLWDHLRSVEIECPARITAVEEGKDTVTVKLSNGRVIHSDLLIVAEGSGSTTSQMLEIKNRAFKCDDRAIVSIAQMASGHGNIAYQRFGKGPLALLPLSPPDLVSVIWSVPGQSASNPIANGASKILKQEIEEISGKVIKIDQISQFAIQEFVVDDFNPYQRVLVVGDSARNMHPMAGQGVNLGIEDLLGIVKVAQRQTLDMGAPNLWRRYAARRRVRSLGMISVMQFFESVYKWTDPYARWLRNVGVRSIDRSLWFKTQLMREAMGMGPVSMLH